MLSDVNYETEQELLIRSCIFPSRIDSIGDGLSFKMRLDKYYARFGALESIPVDLSLGVLATLKFIFHVMLDFSLEDRPGNKKSREATRDTTPPSESSFQTCREHRKLLITMSVSRLLTTFYVGRPHFPGSRFPGR